ncbi:I78 family peptidase inhibitor [Streptomyces sp. NPDC053048]|uniref:I78 family peptidase inhibitor n=1 Tax=Streptomyces sp. NPDC053048 TaxID=3365694 RepID=UPI0037D530BA
MAPLPGIPTEPDDDPEGYVGLDATTATALARERGWSDVRTLAPGTIITLEYVFGRLNLEVEDGIVRRCWKG